jgi:hypothetical protein
MAAPSRLVRNLGLLSFWSLPLALFAACATAEDPPIDGNGASPSSSGTGGASGSAGAGAGSAGKPTNGGSGGTPTGTAGASAGGTSSAAGTAAGGTPPATGGTATGGGGTAPATGGTSSGTCPPYAGALGTDSTIFSGGFGQSTTGMWSGYGFTFIYGTATVTPGKGTSCFAGKKFCASGSIPAADTAGAGLGWNIAQMQGSSTASKVAITTPVKVTFSGVKEGMRVQLSASPTVSYCYTLTATEAAAGSATIAYASFKTECWGTAGMAYDGTVAIESIQVVIPGAAAAMKTFDICVLDIEPG